MRETKRISPAEHRKQIKAYTKEKPHYDVYAEVLKRVLTNACAVSVPEASVQSRAKTVSSFAEKCVRRYAKYPDGVRQLTDLCGARVVVQSQQRVQAVREFIEANFEIDEKETRPSR
jgi:ppGpp synthetase/RelA/SpoT-type nucleotidyltranferase